MGGMSLLQSGSTTPQTLASTPETMCRPEGGLGNAALQSRAPQGTDATGALATLGAGEAQHAETPTGPDAAAQQAAVQEMGEVRALDDTFYAAAGGVLDALVPDQGSKGQVQLNVNIPVDQSGTVRVALRFATEAERDANGVKARVQLGGGATATTETELLFVTLRAFAEAQVFGYLESYGDTGEEAFRLMGLAIRERLASASERVADALFDPAARDAVVAGMDHDDYVDSGLGASFSAGFGVSDGDGGRGGEAGVQGTTGTRLSANAGRLEQTDVDTVEGRLSGSADPFALGGKLTGKWANGTLEAVEGELTGEAMVAVDELNLLVGSTEYVSGIVRTLAGAIQQTSGVLSGEGARMAGGLAQWVNSLGGISLAAEAGTQRALNRLAEESGVRVGHRLTVKGVWDHRSGFSLEVRLDRVAQIELGDNPHRDLVYVLLENVQPVFRVEV